MGLTMTRRKLGSLCSGVGALDLAVEAALDATTVWQAEPAADPARVLERRFPGVPNLGDITRVDWSTVEPVDIIAAGFPCQPASQAGSRLGRDDPRWLWPGVAGAIAALHPSIVVIENVRGLLSLNDADRPAEPEEDEQDDYEPPRGHLGEPDPRPTWSGFGDVLGTLADLGFDAEWGVLRSADIGAPHRRARVFIVAHRRRHG